MKDVLLVAMTEEIQIWKDRITDDYRILHKLTQDLGNSSYIETIDELRERIHDPFLFVIVGEVKAGKSSFINALLRTEEDICAVAPSPMTDKIQQIQYAEEKKTVEVNPNFHRIFIPEEILKTIAVVDTPGTNTIVDHHQEITERFVPVADLVVFVFESKNPYRQSAWEFFKFIQSEWHKKIMLVLQQKDLMEPDDLKINIEGVRSHAIQQGLTDPMIFAVSAKQEREGKTDESGYQALRAYLDQEIIGPKAYVRKLGNYVDTAFNVIERIDSGIKDRELQLEADQKFREEITSSLENHQKLADKQVDLTISHLSTVYNRICDETVEDLNSGLGFFSMMGKSISSIFSKSASPQNWLKDRLARFERDLSKGMNEAIEESHADITELIKQMVKNVSLQIQNSETILKNDHELFSYIAEDRERVISDLQQTFRDFVRSDSNFTFEHLPDQTKSILPQVATGGGLAIIGILISSMTQMMVVDITGGVLSGIGLIFAGVTVGVKKRKLIKKFEEKLDEGRERLVAELGPTLKTYIKDIKARTDAQFTSFDQMVKNEATQVAALRTEMDALINRFDEQRSAIASELSKS